VTLHFIFLFLLRMQALPPEQTAESQMSLLVQQGKLDEAEAASRVYLRGHANSGDAHFLLGYVLFLQAKAKESLAEYTEGAKYLLPSARDLKVVASDYVVLGDFSDADKWFSKVVEWTPDDVQAWYDLGRTKYNENRFDEAVAAFKRTLVLDGANVKALDNLGLPYQGEGHNDEAMAAYERAIAIEEKSLEKNAGPYLDLGSLLIEMERTRDALPWLQKAAVIAPGDFRIWRETGKAYLRLDELEPARTQLEKAIELAPKNAPLHFMLAQVYRKQGLSDKARQETDRYTALK